MKHDTMEIRLMNVLILNLHVLKKASAFLMTVAVDVYGSLQSVYVLKFMHLFVVKMDKHILTPVLRAVHNKKLPLKENVTLILYVGQMLIVLNE
jgi:hypothetical protein